MSRNINAEIGCPFFIETGDSFITCEGLVQGTQSTHTFKNNSSKLSYALSVCGKTCGKKCHHYRTLSALYERGIRV